MNTLATQIRALRDANVRNEDIAAQLGITKNRLQCIVKEHKMPYKTLTRIDMALFEKMYRAGATGVEIEAAVGIRRGNIWRTAQRAGIARRKVTRKRAPEPPAPPTPERIKADPYAGVTCLDGELLRCGRNEAQRAVIAGRHGLTITQARIRWFRLLQEYGE